MQLALIAGVETNTIEVRGHSLKVSIELSPRKRATLRNIFRAESFLKKIGVNSESYILCHKSSKILSHTNEELGETPKGTNAWVWNRENCATCGVLLAGWEEFKDRLSDDSAHFRIRREKRELCVVSWNVQRVSRGLSTLVQHISELREWDAILLQELSFKDEFATIDELESSLGDHKLVTNPICPWDTAIIIHNRWKGAIRWFVSSQYALWVGLKDTEELTFCSVHLPSWVDDFAFELAMVQALEAGRFKASGSIVMGIYANCNVDCLDDQRGALVKDLCAMRGLLPHSQRNWTLAWQPPIGVVRKKKVDFIFSNQTAAIAAIAEDLHSRSDHKPLCLTRSQVPGVMLEFVKKKKSMAGWFPQTLSQHHDLQISVSQRTHLGSTVGQIQQVLESVMSEVEAERLSQCCEPLSDTEIRFDNARRDLQTLILRKFRDRNAQLQT